MTYGRLGLMNRNQSSTVSNLGGGATPTLANDVVSIVGGGRTTQTVSVTDIISEGEIEGLVEGGKSIIIDGNPMFAEGEAPLNSVSGNHATGLTNTTSVTTATAISPDILSEFGDSFLLIKNAVSANVEVSNVGSIANTTHGSKGGFTATLTASSAIFEAAMPHDPGVMQVVSPVNLAHGDATVKLTLANGEHIFGYISALSSTSIVTFKSNTMANMEDFISSTEWNAGNSHKIDINLAYKIASISGTTITLSSNPTVAFTKAQFTVTQPFNPTRYSTPQTESSSYQIRHGTINQTPMTFLKGVGSSSVSLTPAGGNLTRGVSKVISTSGLSAAQKAEIDSVTVLISYPGGLYFMNEESGNTDRPCGAGYRFEIGIQQAGGDIVYQNAGGNLAPGDYHASSIANNGSEQLVGHQGIFKSAVVFEHSLDLTPFQPFQDFSIRITRVTNHGTIDDGANFETAHFGIVGQGVGGALKTLGNTKYKGFMTSTIQSATGIIKEKLNYPHTALANIQFNSKQFQGLPKRAYHVRGIKVSVPSNYTTREENEDSETESIYTGSWDGNFRSEKVYTNNPAWVFHDILTNNRYGLGQWLGTLQIDKYSLYRIGKYCDELVPDGKGGTEPRFTANLYLTKAADAYKVLKDMATIFRGMLYWLEGQVVPVIDEKKFPVYNFSKSNVIGEFQYEGTGHKTRANQYVVKWNNPDAGYKLEPLIVEDRLDIIKKGKIITKSATAFGCTSEGQAIRYGRWKLWTAINQTELVSFKTGLNAAFLVPGDIVNIQDADDFDIPFSGRLNSYTETGGNKLTLDRDIDAFLPTSGYSYRISLIVPKKVAILNQDSATVNSVALTRGDIVTTARIIKDGSQAALVNANDDTMKLNVANALDDSNNSLTLILRESTVVQERVITGSSTVSGTSVAVPAAAVDGKTTVQVTEALDEVLTSDLPNAIWAIKQIANSTSTATEASSKEYKILGLSENDDLTYDISAARHYNAKFDSVELDFGLSVADPLFPPEPPASPPGPKSVYVLRTPNRFKAGEEVILQWEAPANYDFVKAFEVTHNFTENQVAVTEEVGPDVLRMAFSELGDGTYFASIRSITERGKKSKPTETFVELTDIFEGDRIQGIRKGGAATSPMNISSSNVFFTGESYKIGPISNNPHGSNQELRKQNNASNSGSITQSINALSSGSWAGQKNGSANYAYVFYDYSNASHASNDVMRLVSWKVDGDLGLNYWYDADKYAASSTSIWTNLSGTVAVAEGSNKVVGTNTSFTSLDVTRVLKLSASFGASIAFIESDTVLFIDRPATTAISAGTTAQVDELGIDYRTDFLLGQATHQSGTFDFTSFLTLTPDVELTPKTMSISCSVPELSYSSNGTLVSTFSNIKLRILPIGFENPEVKVTGGGFSQVNQSAETSYSGLSNGFREVTLHSVAHNASPAVTFAGGALDFSVEVREKNNTSATQTQTFSLTKVQASAEDAASGFSATLSNVAHTFFAASGSAATNDYSGTFSIVSGATTYTFASSGTTANTYGVSVTAATGGIATNQVNIASSSSQAVVTLNSAAAVIATSTTRNATFTLQVIDRGNSDAVIGNFTVTLSKVILANRDGITVTIDGTEAEAIAFKGTLDNTNAGTIGGKVIAKAVPDGILQVARIVPNDKVTVKNGNIVATRVYTGSAKSSGVVATDFSSVVAAEFDGSVIVDGTLSAEKLLADSTITNKLNVGNQMILNTGGIFHTPGKTAFTGTGSGTNGFFLDTSGNFFLGSDTNHLKYTASSGAFNLAGTLSVAGPTGNAGPVLNITPGSIVLPVDSSNAVTAFPTTTATISAFVGGTPLQFVAPGDGDGQYDSFTSAQQHGLFTVTVSASGITAGAITDTGTGGSVGQASNLIGTTATITYTLEGKFPNGDALPALVKTQSISKTTAGADGTATQGQAFLRIETTAANANPNANPLAATIAGNTVLGRSPIVGDTIIVVATDANPAPTQVGYRFQANDQGANVFVQVSALIDGSLIVTDSITTSQIDADAITASELAISSTTNSGSGIFFDTTTTNLNPRIVIREGNAERVILGKLS